MVEAIVGAIPAGIERLMSSEGEAEVGEEGSIDCTLMMRLVEVIEREEASSTAKEIMESVTPLMAETIETPASLY